MKQLVTKLRVIRYIESSLALLLAVTSPSQQPAADNQAPPQAPDPAPIELIPLPKLLAGTVYQVQPLAGTPAAEASTPKAEPGTAHERAVARVCDALFDDQGALQALLVDSVEQVRTDGAPPFVLQAADVRWDASRKVLVTSLDADGIAGLPTVKYGPVKYGDVGPGVKTDKKGCGGAAERKTHRASELVAAKPRCSDTEPGKSLGEPPRVLWYAPGAGRLAGLTVQAAGKPRLLPWILVQPVGTGVQLTLELAATKSLIEGAPAPADERKAPDADARRTSYRHFARAVPDWEDPAIREVRSGGRRP